MSKELHDKLIEYGKKALYKEVFWSLEYCNVKPEQDWFEWVKDSLFALNMPLDVIPLEVINLFAEEIKAIYEERKAYTEENYGK